MPSYHIWIRKEDEAKWKAIINKPQWLHIALNTSLIEMAINQTSVKLSPEGVAAYEKASGFKTTGDVTITKNADAVQKIYENLLEPTITPAEETL